MNTRFATSGTTSAAASCVSRTCCCGSAARFKPRCQWFGDSEDAKRKRSSPIKSDSRSSARRVVAALFLALVGGCAVFRSDDLRPVAEDPVCLYNRDLACVCACAWTRKLHTQRTTGKPTLRRQVPARIREQPAEVPCHRLNDQDATRTRGEEVPWNAALPRNLRLQVPTSHSPTMQRARRRVPYERT